MALIDENGQPLPTQPQPEEPPVNPEAPSIDSLHEAIGDLAKALGEQGEPCLVLTLRREGNLTVEGPGDLRITLRMLHEALDVMQAQLAANVTLARLSAARQGVQRPGMKDVLAFSKVHP